MVPQKKKLTEGKIKIMSMNEFKKKSEVDPTGFGCLNIAYNPDSSSTKVSLIHGFNGRNLPLLQALVIYPSL